MTATYTGEPRRAGLLTLDQPLWSAVDAATTGLPGLAARIVFLLVLAPYYLASALTKVGEGFPGALLPDAGAYVQILPGAMERAGYDPSQIGPFGQAVVHAGTWAEVVLPVLVVMGLLARWAALGMIGFVLVQSVVDVTGHGADAATIGAWLDRAPDAAILDQRLLWVFVLATVVLKGAGWLSLDRRLGRG